MISRNRHMKMIIKRLILECSATNTNVGMQHSQHHYWDAVQPTLILGCSATKTNVGMQPGVWGQSPQQALNP